LPGEDWRAKNLPDTGRAHLALLLIFTIPSEGGAMAFNFGMQNWYF
jgi:hypothetical protein